MDAKYLKEDKHGKVLIIQCVSDEYLEYIKDRTTTFQMWKALENTFQRKGTASQLFLRKKLLIMLYNKNEKSLEMHLLDLN